MVENYEWKNLRILWRSGDTLLGKRPSLVIVLANLFSLANDEFRQLSEKRAKLGAH